MRPQSRFDVASELHGRRRLRSAANVSTAGLERSETHQDARRTEATLAGTARDERIGPPVALVVRHALERCDLSPPDPPYRGDACDPGCSVNPDGAAAALTLRATAVLDRAAPEFLAQCVEKRDALGRGDLAPVQDEGNEGVGGGAAQGTGRPGGRRLS